MSDANLLLSFVSWAAAHQQRLLSRGSNCVTSLQVGRATANRAVTFTVEVFAVEATGWIGEDLQEGGTLTVWENGCADADWVSPADFQKECPSPSYLEHWDELSPDELEAKFARFASRFESL